jgi:hypothetical protein
LALGALGALVFLTRVVALATAAYPEVKIE